MPQSNWCNGSSLSYIDLPIVVERTLCAVYATLVLGHWVWGSSFYVSFDVAVPCEEVIVGVVVAVYLRIRSE